MGKSSYWSVVSLSINLRFAYFFSLFFILSACQKVETFYQDTGNYKVISKSLFGRNTVLFSGDKTLSESGNLELGVKKAFNQSLFIGEYLAIHSPSGAVSVFKLSNIADRSATFSDETKEVNIVLNEYESLLPDSESVRWSIKDSTSIYIYSDNYIELDKSAMYSVSYGDDANSAILNDLPARYPWNNPRK